MIVYLALGGNMGDRVGTLQQGLRFLIDHPQIRLLACSSFYETEPVGYADQDWFVNAAVAIDTTLSPLELLAWCQDIENRMGRVRDPENIWGPRTLDIDILFYGDQIVEEPNLQIPHPRLSERAFYLVPLLEIHPDSPPHPITGQTISSIHQALSEPEEVFLYGTRRALEL